MRIKRSRQLSGAFFALLCSVSGSLLLANPNPGNAVIQHGSFTFVQKGGTLRVYQTTQNGIIDWNSFSIAGGETTKFIQPNSTSIAMNRVTGQTVSRIDGRLAANGRIFLINPNGIVVGRTGVIDVAGFTASTLDLSNHDLLAGGDLRFKGDSQASVVNLGEISAFEGDVFLVAASVLNAGRISAPNGTVGLAAGNDVLITASGTERVFVKGASGEKKENGVVNQGDIDANIAELRSYGGNIYGMAVKNEGRVAATGVTRSGGQIFLSAGGNASRSGGRVRSTGSLVARAGSAAASKPKIKIDAGDGGEAVVGGSVVASADPQGGTIVFLGDSIDLMADSVIIADGETSGGNILIGGGRRGLDPDLRNATDIRVSEGAVLSANAGEIGDGGEIILFAERDLSFQGFATAKGGQTSGNGGFVELSGKRSVKMGSLVDSVDVTAPNGRGGLLLFDPEDIDILPGTLEEGVPTGESEPQVTSESPLYAEDINSFLGTASLRIETDESSTVPGAGNVTLRANADLNWNSESNLEIFAAGTFFMEDESSITSQWAGASGGNLTIWGGVGVQLGSIDSAGEVVGPRISTGIGNISISTLDPSTIPDPEMTTTGIQIYESEITSGVGEIGVKGYSNADGFAGLGLYNSRVLANAGGDIDLSGVNFYTIPDPDDYEGSGAEGLEVDIYDSSFFDSEGASAPVIGTTGIGKVSIFGRAQGSEAGIEFDGPFGEGDLWMGDVSGNGPIDSVDVVSGGGITELFGVETNSFNYSVEEGATAPLFLSGAIGEFSATNADWIEINQTSRNLTVRDVDASVGLDVSIGGFQSLFVGENVNAEEIFFSGDEQSFFQNLNLSTIPAASSITISDFTSVDVWGTVDLGVFTFNNVGEVQGNGPDSRVVGSDQTTFVDVSSVFVEDESSSASSTFFDGPSTFITETRIDENPFSSVETVFHISELDTSSPSETGGFSRTESTRFTGFQEVSGGGGNDIFDIHLAEGAVFDGMLLGGEGSDIFQLGNPEISGEGRAFSIGAIDGGDSNGSVDVDLIDFFNLGSSVEVDFGQGTAQWGDSGSLNSVSGIEQIFGDSMATAADPNILRGTPGADQFEITHENGGALNGIQFFGFGQLEGAQGSDRFGFTNQANVQKVIGGKGFDTINFSRLGSPVTVDFGNGNARWGPNGGITSIMEMERVVGDMSASVQNPNILRGTSGVDQFAINQDNGGSLNGIQFSGFGRLEGVAGADQFVFSNLANVQEVIGGKGFDTIDFSGLGSPVTVDFGNGNARWGSNGGINSIMEMERVVGDRGASARNPNILRGTSSADQFLITENNGGFLNNGQFSGFGRLEGAGGQDQFRFTSQANVQEVIGGPGFDTIIVDDQNLRRGGRYTITDNTIIRNPTYTFSELEALQILLGSGNDTITTTGNGLIQILNGGAGTNVIDFGGAPVEGTNPFTVGGSRIFATNFENPFLNFVEGEVVGETQALLTNQTTNSPNAGGQPNPNSNMVGQGTETTAPTPLASDLGLGGNAFAATPLVNQAVVLPFDGMTPVGVPIGLDGTGALPPIEVITALKGNLSPEIWRDLADAIDFDGGTLLVVGDGPVSVDLRLLPADVIALLLKDNLAVSAAGELLGALEMTLVLPITSLDGPVGIVAIPVAIEPELANLLSQLLDQDALAELSSALDAE